jgi:chromosome partitioning protein
MPSLGMLTVNALTAADEVIIPVQAQYLPAKGMTQLMKSIEMVRSHTNEELKIGGILMTLVDGRTNLAKDVIQLTHVKATEDDDYRSVRFNLWR